MDNLPKGWNKFKMIDVCDVRDGTHDSPKYIEKGHPLVTSKNLKNYGLDLSDVSYISDIDYEAINKRSKVDKGDILFAMIGTIGNPIVVTMDPYFAIKNMALFKPTKKISSNFLCYYLNSPYVIQKMSDEANGATQKFVGLGYLRNFQIPLPPLSEQTRIVANLDALFVRIDKSIALLEENIKHTKALMASVLEEVFGNEKETKLGEILSLKRGYDLPTQFRVKGDYALLGANGIIDYHKDYKAVGPGVCTGRSGSIGLVHYIQDNYWPLNTSLYVEDFKNNNRRYIYYLLKSASSGLIQQAAFAAVPTLDRKKAHEFIFVKYHNNLEDQIRISSYLDQVSQTETKILSSQQSKLVFLKALKSSLLDRAFKGEL